MRKNYNFKNLKNTRWWSTKFILVVIFVFALAPVNEVYAQEICTQTFSASGIDADPTVLTINAADVNCNGSETINSIAIINSAGSLSNFNCNSWYDFTLNVDGTDIVTGCSANINGTDVTGFSTITITSADTDNWSDAVTIQIDLEVDHETPSCITPANLAVSNLTTSGLDLSWDEEATAEEGYEWVVMLEGEAPDPGTAVATASTPGLTENIGGLDANTSYSAYVRSDCGVDGESDWSSAVNFTTLCDAVSIFPYNETFDTFLNNCWAQATGNASEPVSIGTSSWNTGTFNGNSSAKYNMYNNTTAQWLLTETYDLGTGTDYQVVLDIAATTWNNLSTPANFGVDDEVGLMISTDGGDTWTSLGVYTEGSAPSNTGQQDAYDLSSYSGEVQFGIYAIASAGTGSDHDLYVTNFKIEEIPDCITPANLAVSNLTASGLDLSWDEEATAEEGYEWVVMLEGEAPDPGTAVDTASTTLLTENIGGLDANTSYSAYVRSECGVGEFSDWSSAVNFTTLPDFCAGDNFYDSGGASGDYGNNENITTVISPDTPGDVVTVSFLSFNTELNWDSLMIHDGPDASSPVISSGSTVSKATVPIGAWHGTGAFSAQGESFTSTHPSGALTFVFRSDGSGTRDGWEAEVTCGPPPSCITPANLAVSNLTASGLDLSWDAEATAEEGYNWFLMADGEHPDDDTALQSGNVTTESVNITGLTQNTTYDIYIQSDCGGGDVSEFVTLSLTTPVLESSPWTENFNTAGQDGWDLTGWTRGTTTTSGGIEGRDGSDVIRRNLWSSATTGFIETVNVGPIQSGDYLSYEYRLKNFGANNVNPVPTGACTFTVSGNFSISGSVTLQSFSNDDKLGWQKKYIDLSDYVGETIQINIAATRNSGDFFLYFDNFAIKNVDGFVYADNSQGWLTGNPVGTSTNTDVVEVVEGNTTFNSNVEAAELIVFAQASLDIEDVLEIEDELYTDGETTFKSTSTKTAQLVPSASAEVKGDVTVERYIPGGNRAFRLLSSSVDSNESIYENWQEGGMSPAGFGTHITGSETGDNGFDETNTGNASMFVFNHTVTDQGSGAAWEAVANTDATNLEAGKLYRLMVRGDRNIDLTQNNPSANPTVLRAKGELKMGSLTTGLELENLSLEDGNFSYLANPYQAIVNLATLTYNGDVNSGYIYAWDPSLSSSGAYAVVTVGGGAPDPVDSNASPFLMPGQAVFVRNNTSVTTNPSIEFTQASISPSTPQTEIFSESESYLPYINMKLFKTDDLNQGEGEIDGAGLRFDGQFSNLVTDEDAAKLANPQENIAFLNGNNILQIENRNIPIEGEVIPVVILGYTDTAYSFKFKMNELPGEVNAVLHDKYLDTYTLLEDDLVIDFEVDESISESSNFNRFEITFEETFGVNEMDLKSLSLYPNPTSDLLNIQVSNNLSGKTEVNVIDLQGRVVMTKNQDLISGQTQLNVNNLSAGMYLIELNHENKTFKSKFIKQ